MNYVGMTITRRVKTTDPVTGLPVPTPDIVFKWRVGIWGEIHTIVPTPIDGPREEASQFEASFIPDRGGILFYRWDTDGATDIAKEDKLFIKDTAFCS